MRPTLAAALLIALAYSGAQAQTTAVPAPAASGVNVLDGDWHGAISPALTLVARVRTDAGKSVMTLDAPEQLSSGMTADSLSVEGGKVRFSVGRVSGAFEGEMSADGRSITGVWTQRGASSPFTLTRGLPPARPAVTGLDGRWEGVIDAGGARLRLVFNVRTGPLGTYSTLDSPDQLASGIPVSAVSRDGGAVRLEVRAAGGAFAGQVSADGQTITGHWSQGADIPLTLRRVEAAARRRPQTPRKPYPYAEEEVVFANPAAPGVTLAGSLTLPQGEGPFPAAVLITGSGAQDRDETLFGHKPFLVIADHLTRKGIAVLRVDDRGAGKSTAGPAGATTADLATDTAAAVAYLRGRKDIRTNRIGLIGHSEGGVIAPIVAAEDPRIAFTVLLAAPAGSGDELLLSQQRLIGLAGGRSEADMDRIEPVMRRALAVVRDAPNQATALAAARGVFAEPEAAAVIPPAMAEQQLAFLTGDWMRFFLAYDSRPALTRVRAPVLALTGAKDVQVAAAENLEAIRAATTGNPDVTARALQGLNHLFQTAPTGALGEYADLEETFSPAALTLIGDWVAARVK